LTVIRFDAPPNTPSQSYNHLQVTAINDHRQVLGTLFGTDAKNNANRFWFIYDPAKGYQVFDPQPAEPQDSGILTLPPGGINNNGTAVLTNRLRRADGTEILLSNRGTLAGSRATYYAINNHDAIVGQYEGNGFSELGRDDTYFSFIRQPDGNAPAVLCPDASRGMIYVYGVNDNGAVSGYVPNTASESTGIAVLARPTGKYSALQLSHTDWTFSSHPVGEASGTGTIYLTSKGDADLNIVGLLEGAGSATENAQDFSITSNNCMEKNVNGYHTSGTLPPGAFCAISFRFKPTAGGARNASIVVYDDAPDAPHVIRLHGVGLGTTSLKLSNTSWTFSRHPIGEASGLGKIYVYNPGPVAATFSNIGVTGKNAADFAVVSNGCGNKLNPYTTCAISFQFKPTATGSRTASLALSNSTAQSVSLAGVGY
jgi:hypothetical protein